MSDSPNPEQRDRQAADTAIIDQFVSVQAGEPYRLLPFGKLVKGGKVRFITPELAHRFKLPGFKPPIKRGSHREETPAGGHIVGLEVRADGLYAIPEFTEAGMLALNQGDYRYHSPEIIWDDNWMEDPLSGEKIFGPMIVGDALLHTPHLGEAAALYEIQPIGGTEMSETIAVPTGLWDKFVAWVGRENEPPPVTSTWNPTPPALPEDYSALQAKAAQVDTLAAEIETLKADQARRDLITSLSAEVGKTKLAREGAAEMLAGMTDEQRTWVMQQATALSAQIKDESLLAPHGRPGGQPADGDPAGALNSAVQAKATEKKISWLDAYGFVKAEQPELFRAYEEV